MTLRGKLTVNAVVTVAAVLVVGIASLVGFYHVKGKVRDVTDSSTPYQLKTLEFTKVLQEHAAALLAAGNAHGQEELAGKERELGRTLGGLRGLTSEIGELNRTAGIREMDRTVNDVDGLTREIVSSANERVRAEERAEVVVKEAKARLRMLAENRAALQESLKALQDTAVSSLMRSSSKTKLMTGAFRSLQRIKDVFEELRLVFADFDKASSGEELLVVAWAVHLPAPRDRERVRGLQTHCRIDRIDERAAFGETRSPFHQGRPDFRPCRRANGPRPCRGAQGLQRPHGPDRPPDR